MINPRYFLYCPAQQRLCGSRPASGLDGLFDVLHREAPHMWLQGRGPLLRPERTRSDTMRCLLRSLLCCAALLLSGVRATYHPGAGEPQLIAAQSYAQTRNNGRPPMRTLNPASKFHPRRGFIGLGVTFSRFTVDKVKELEIL